MLFSQVGPKPDSIKTVTQDLQNPSCISKQPPLFKRWRSYAEALKMDAGRNDKGSTNGRQEDEERNYAPTHGGQNSG